MANQTINVIVNSKGVVTVVKELNAMGDAARQTTTYLNGLRAILAAALTFSGVGAIVEVVDNFTVLQNRLKQVTKESDAVGESWKQLVNIANQSYSSIDSTVNLYFRVAQAYKAWGESAKGAYEFTELFQKAAILSGSSVQTTSQAVYQFSQALNKGKLDGDEFRSVLEGLPYVASLIQKSLGVTRAELYELSADGKISVDRLRQAFRDAAKTIRSDFENITPTIGMALVVLRNNWTDFVGEIQTSTGIFSAVAYAILAIANNFDLLAIALTPVAAAFVWMAGRLGIGLIVVAFRDMAQVLQLATAAQWLFNAAVSANPYVIIGAAIAAVIAAIIYFRNEIGLTTENLNILWQVATSVFSAIWSAITSVVSVIAQVVVKLYEWTSVFNLILKGAQTFAKALLSLFSSISKAVADVGRYIANSLIPVWNDLIAIAREFLKLIQEVAAFFVERLAPAVNDLKAAWDILWDAMRPGLMFVVQVLKDIWDGWKLLADWLDGTFTRVIKDVFDGWILILREVLGFIRSIISALRQALALLRQVAGAGGSGGSAGGAHYGAQFKAGQGFATGGQFKVGGTGAGRDTTPVAFRAERGERVTVETKKQQRQNDNKPAAANVNVPVQINNVVDPNAMVAVNESAAGQRSILNVITMNRDEILAVLGA